VADLFLHGIGGGKYDEVTDELARAFYRIEPPAYGVLTATLLLPLEHWQSDLQTVHDLERRVRDLEFNAERFLDDGLRFNELALRLRAQKQSLIEQTPTAQPARKQRFLQLRDLNARLADFVTQEREDAASRLDSARQEVSANAILDSRDYSFCLYPEAMLREFMSQFLHPVPEPATPAS
jgi:hypothetical protein